MAIHRLEIQNAIKATLESVEGVANVYVDEAPRIDDYEEFKTAYETEYDGFVQLWTIQRTASPARTAQTHSGQIPISDVHFYHNFRVELFWGYEEDTGESVFQALIDAVLDEFKNKRTLGAFSTAKPLDLASITPEWRHNVMGKVAVFDVTVIDPQRALAWQ